MLKIDIEKKENAVIITIDGELSLRSIDEFDQAFKRYINSDLAVAALDLKHIQYLDSFAISRIIKISRSFTGSSTEFVLVNMNDDIHRIFKMATFDRLFKIMTIEEFFKTYVPENNSIDSLTE